MGDGPHRDEPSRLDDMRFERVEPPRFSWIEFTFLWAIGFLLPRYAYWSRWPDRLSGRGLALYLALKAGQGVAVRYWVVPWLRRQGRAQEEAKAKLRDKLGRDPTDDELFEYLTEQQER